MKDRELDVEAFAAALAGDDDGRRLAALDALQECDRRGPLPAALLEPLLECLAHRRKAVQRTAAEVLALWARVTPGIRGRLLERLGGEALHARWGAAFTLAKIGPEPAAFPVLVETLGESDGDMRWAAQVIVVDLARRDPAHAGALVALAGDGTPAQRKMALYCLRDLGVRSDALRAVLLEALSHAEAEVRLAALSAVAALFGGEAAIVAPVLRLAREDPEPGVRRAAVSTIGKLHPPPGHEEPLGRTLAEAAGSDDAGLRRAAIGAQRKRRGGGP